MIQIRCRECGGKPTDVGVDLIDHCETGSKEFRFVFTCNPCEKATPTDEERAQGVSTGFMHFVSALGHEPYEKKIYQSLYDKIAKVAKVRR